MSGDFGFLSLSHYQEKSGQAARCTTVCPDWPNITEKGCSRTGFAVEWERKTDLPSLHEIPPCLDPVKKTLLPN